MTNRLGVYCSGVATWLNTAPSFSSANILQHYNLTDAIKMAWARVMVEGQQTDQKCTPVKANQEKIKRTTKQKMDGLY